MFIALIYLFICVRQIVSVKTWTALADSKLASASGTTSNSSSHSSCEVRPTHVAFGKKVAIPDHILTSRQVNCTDTSVSVLTLFCIV